MTKTYQHDQPADHSSSFSLTAATAWDILTNAVKDYRYNGGVNMAAAIAFYCILSIIPFFILTLLAAGLVFGSHPNIQDEMIGIIQIFHPYFSGKFFEHLGHIEQKMQVLGWVGGILLFWLSSRIFNSVQTSMGIILHSQNKRRYVTSKLLIIAIILIGWLVMLVTMGITYLSTFLEHNIVIAKKSWFFYSLFFRYFLPYVVTLVFFTSVYKFIPSTTISWGNALSASFLFTTLTEISKHLFTWYVSHYAQYNIIFGSLETVMLFIIWVFYLSVIFLFCAELISSYLRRDLILLEKAFLKPGDNT